MVSAPLFSLTGVATLPVPQATSSNAADLSYVDAAFEALAPHLSAGSLVVGKSTVPVGTAARLAERLAVLAPQAALAWNPEFLREGYAVRDTLEPDRLVYGVGDDHAASVLDQVYRAAIEAGTPRIVTAFIRAPRFTIARISAPATSGDRSSTVIGGAPGRCTSTIGPRCPTRITSPSANCGVGICPFNRKS